MASSKLTKVLILQIQAHVCIYIIPLKLEIFCRHPFRLGGYSVASAYFLFPLRDPQNPPASFPLQPSFELLQNLQVLKQHLSFTESSRANTLRSPLAQTMASSFLLSTGSLSFSKNAINLRGAESPIPESP